MDEGNQDLDKSAEIEHVKEYGLFAIGNALMDILVEVGDGELEQHPVTKGTMNLMDKEGITKVESKLQGKSTKAIPGGAAANAMAIFAQLGGKGVFCGCVGIDDTGNDYTEAMRELGLMTNFGSCYSMTGRAITFITPDCQRTFATHLGAALKLQKEHVDLGSLGNSRMLYLTGYVVDGSELTESALHALKYAKEKGIRIAFDIADPGVIERNRDNVINVVDNYADIVFANEDEAKALTGESDPHDALEALSKKCDIAVVKIGRRGSLIRKGSETYHINPYKVEAVDTTGAGDSYAGAFLYALSEGHDLETAGRLASYISAHVVKQVGARLEKIPEVSHILDN